MQITEAERDRVANWWKQKGLKHAPSKWVAICPGAKVTSKLWPWERYGEVMRRLMEQHGAFPVVIGGKEDREIGEKLLALWGGGLCAAGELGVRESAALMASALFYLGNDTGVMHLAAAMGRPCVAVFSARDWPGRWHPYGVNHQVLRFDVPCSGCRLINCDQELRCLRGVSVDRVYQACLAVLAKQKSPECVAR